MNLYDLSHPSKKKKQQLAIESRLAEFAADGGGDSGNYFQALASAWYNGTFDTGSLEKGIKSQEDVERLLNRGIVCPDGVTRKLHIDYNSDFNGVEIFSDDYYEHGDYDDTIDSRTGQKWGPYDFMAFSDDQLDEATGDQKFDSMMSQMTSEPKYPDQDMPPTSVPELIQWADTNNKPYHEYFAQWARKNGFTNVNDALVWFGDNVDPSNPWGPKDFEDPFGRPAAEELEDAAKHDPKAAELMKVFRCYEEIVFDWPDEYRQMNMPTSRKGTDEGVAEGAPISGDGGAVDNFKQQMANNTEVAYQKKQQGMAEGDTVVKHRIGLTVTDPNHPMASKRNQPIQKTVRVPGEDPAKAINAAIAHYRRKGYKVHDHHYMGTVDYTIDEAAPDWLRRTAGAATGALAGVGASFPGAAIAGPVGGAVAGAYGAKAGYDLGAGAADWVYDKVTGKRVSADKAEVDEELTMKHQRDHDTQRRPDISNSLADRGFDMSEKPNVSKSFDGHPTVKWRHHGHAGHTRVEPTLNPTSVGRLVKTTIPNSLKKKEVEEAGMPSSVVKNKQRYVSMSDSDFAKSHKEKSDDELKAMAWRHGYGKGSSHYVNKRNKGQQGVAEGSLSEVDRRGFLKGLGAAAAGGVAGVGADRLLNRPPQRPTPQQVISDGIKSGKWSLKGYHDARNDGYSDEEIADYISDYKYKFYEKPEPPAPANYPKESVEQGVAEGGYQHGFADPNAPSLGGSRRKDDEGNLEFDDRMRRQTGMIFYNVDDAELAQQLGLKQTRTGKWYLRTGNRHAQQSADRAFGLGRIWYPKNETVESDQLGELSNELLGRYKKELGVRARDADRAGDYDAGHEYFKKINRATMRQGDNDARRHAEKENDVMETRLNMMRKAGYDL